MLFGFELTSARILDVGVTQSYRVFGNGAYAESQRVFLVRFYKIEVFIS